MTPLAQDVVSPTTATGALIVVCLSVVGVLVWLVRYILTTTLPALTTQFTAALHEVETDSKESFKEVMSLFRDAHKELIVHLGALDTGIQHIKDNQHTILDTIKSRMHLGDAVTSAGDAIFTKSLNGTILSWNEGAERLLGWKPSEIIGKSSLLIIPKDMHEDEEENLQKCKRGEYTGPFQTKRICRDGRQIDVSVTISPIREHETGKVIGASVIARPV